MKYLMAVLTVVIALAGRQIARAQPPAGFPAGAVEQLTPTDRTEDSRNLEAVRIEREVKPAFIINPLVHRLTARRGATLEFAFEIEANARPTRLEIMPVAMVQQEQGAIMPDSQATPPDVIQMLSSPTASLQVGESFTIRCRMKVPVGNAPFLSYGILVKELPPEEGSRDQDPDKPRVGIRFLTQYLLRVDLQVIGARGESVAALEVPAARLASRDGNAAILCYIENPTETPMEFEVRSSLVSEDNLRSVTSMLWMPVRATQPAPDKYRVRILGNTRLRLEGALTEAVFPGRYRLEIELLHRRRVYRKVSFPVKIRSGDFPAQDASIVRVTRDISVEPPHVELSLRKGGNRIQALTISNDSKQRVVARVSPQPLHGDLHNWLVFRPDEVVLEPGRSRKVLVMLGSKRNFDDHTYATARISVRPEVGEAIGTQDIPVALLTNSPSTPKLETGSLQWKVTDTAAGFEVAVRNVGKRHVPLAGQLVLRDEFGRGFTIEDGYGRWLLPEHEDRLWFAFPQIPPPGTYKIRATISQGKELEPVQLQQTIRLQTAPPEQLSQNGS